MSGGGDLKPKESNYHPPAGPKNMSGVGPGLHGGTNLGKCGTQGSYESPGRESGRPGIGGTNHGHGTNRKG